MAGYSTMISFFLLLTVCSGINSQGLDCGILLRPNATNDPTPPSGWTMCYIDQRDELLWEIPCTNLLVGLPTYNDAQGLMAAGGNFGCWNLQEYPSPDSTAACLPNLQHQLMVATCLRCTSMAVCIRYPGSKASEEGVENV